MDDVASSLVPVGPTPPVDHRQLARFLAAGRLLLGMVSLVGPGMVARSLGANHSPGTKLVVRAFGAREIVLAAGCLHTLDHDPGAPTWLHASAVADAVDAGATLMAGRALGPARALTGAAVAASAAIGNWRAADRLD